MSRDKTVKPAKTGFPIGLTITVIIALAILIGLGVWQVKRLEWKTKLLADVAAARVADVQPLSVALMQGNAEYHRASVDCSSLATAPFIELYALMDGQPGKRLISPCYSGDGTILVDRGFISDEVTDRPTVGPSDAVIHMVGVLRKGDKGNAFTPPATHTMFYARDLAAMKTALNVTNGVDYFLMAETSSNPDWPALKPMPLPGDIPNRHLEYALTWFGLAVVLVAIYAAMLMRRLKGQ